MSEDQQQEVNEEHERARERAAEQIDQGSDKFGDGITPDYVKQLRNEAAENRVKRTEAEDKLPAKVQRVVELEVERAALRGILVDGDDLLHHVKVDELLDPETGEPDAAKIKAAAEKLAADKPHLAARRVAVDVGQGPRGAVAPDGLAAFGDVLRGAAR